MGASFSKESFKAGLAAAQHRIKLHRQKRANEIRIERREVAASLRANQIDKARIRVESVIRKEGEQEAEETLELMCDLVSSRLGVVCSSKSCPSDMLEVVHTLIWAAPYTQIQELRTIRAQLVLKYGEEFAHPAIKAAPPPKGHVNEKVKAKLSVQMPDEATKILVLKDIAREFEVAFNPEELPANSLLPPIERAALEEAEARARKEEEQKAEEAAKAAAAATAAAGAGGCANCRGCHGHGGAGAGAGAGAGGMSPCCPDGVPPTGCPHCRPGPGAGAGGGMPMPMPFDPSAVPMAIPVVGIAGANGMTYYPASGPSQMQQQQMQMQQMGMGMPMPMPMPGQYYQPGTGGAPVGLMAVAGQGGAAAGGGGGGAPPKALDLDDPATCKMGSNSGYAGGGGAGGGGAPPPYDASSPAPTAPGAYGVTAVQVPAGATVTIIGASGKTVTLQPNNGGATSASITSGSSAGPSCHSEMEDTVGPAAPAGAAAALRSGGSDEESEVSAAAGGAAGGATGFLEGMEDPPSSEQQVAHAHAMAHLQEEGASARPLAFAPTHPVGEHEAGASAPPVAGGPGSSESFSALASRLAALQRD